jgi:hypothetical protein
MEYDTISLQALESPEYASIRTDVMASLEKFECKRSPHLENFARSKVWDYESSGMSRTYVLTTVLPENVLEVAALFTIGLTTFDFTKLEKSVKKKLLGKISLEIGGAYSIAELARSDKYTNQDLEGMTILNEASKVILNAQTIVGGRYVIVDAQAKIHDTLYSKAGFRVLHPAIAPLTMADKEFFTGACIVRDL